MHVDKLGLNLTYGLKLDSSLVGAANLPTSPANTFLKQSSMGYIRNHFNLTVRPTASLLRRNLHAQPIVPGPE
jgi:hypothetical protein